MQCPNASSESNTWWFYSSIGYAEWHPLASPPEVCQSFKEVLSTLRPVGDAHWARAVASALGVCLAGIRPEGKVRTFHCVHPGNDNKNYTESWDTKINDNDNTIITKTNYVSQRTVQLSIVSTLHLFDLLSMCIQFLMPGKHSHLLSFFCGFICRVRSLWASLSRRYTAVILITKPSGLAQGKVLLAGTAVSCTQKHAKNHVILTFDLDIQ